MKFSTFSELVAAAVLLAGFSACNTEAVIGPEEQAQATVIGSPTDAVEGSLLIYVDEAFAAELAATVPSDGSSVESGALIPEISKINRIFRGSDKKALTKASGADYKLHRWFSVSFDEETSLSEMAAKLAKLPQIQKVQYNQRVYPGVEPEVYPYSPAGATKATRAVAAGTFPVFDDPGLADQWHYSNDGTVCRAALAGADINVTDAWRLTGGDSKIVIAIIDDGVWYEHPDLQANMWINEDEIPDNGIDDDGNGYIDDFHGVNFCYEDYHPVTWNIGQGHGTHVAGTVAAVNNNGIGVCGVAGGTGNNDGVRIMTCQIFEGELFATVEQVAAAFTYAKENGAVIIQGSFGFQPGDFRNDGFYRSEAGAQADALDDFINNNDNFSPWLEGGLAIFSAGNGYTGTVCYPGGYTNAICVTALGCDGLPTLYTCYGHGANIAAPGGESGTGGQTTISACVLSTMPMEYKEGLWEEAGYAFMQGTSMACPHVSGTAALGLAYAKKLGKTYTREEFTSLLLTSVNDLDSRLEGDKYSLRASDGAFMTMKLAGYRGFMGTGSIDAWRLLMQIEGTPCLLAAVGVEQEISLDEYFGGGSESITYLGVTISDEDKASLGLTEDPRVNRSGKLVIRPTKYGSGKITVRAVGGGSNVGSDQMMGGQEISKEISIVTRGIAASNNGWL